jgi:meiotically up-regulated gene 157 (Mug157) protein
MERRDFLKYAGATAVGIMATNGSYLFAHGNNNHYTTNRPPFAERKFTSTAVEEIIKEVKAKIKDPEVAWLFENCYPNTIDTTVFHKMVDGKPESFIITGDIDAMWLRDSTAQVWPYMPLLNKDEKLKTMVKGLVRKQIKCVLLDPYANAFYDDKTRKSHWAETDKPSFDAGVHERKWEIDSLCYVVRLADEYYRITKDDSMFDKEFDQAMRLIYKTFRTEQRKDGTTPYWFERTTSAMIDAPFNKTGRPIKPNGLICSMFRPSDDATLFPFLIPSNLFAVLSLRQMSKFYNNNIKDNSFAKECNSFADEVEKAVKDFAIVKHENFGNIYAYEVDGFGNKVFMDDANVPSLMSLAYLGYHKSTDPLYKRTRKFLLSDSNPYYLKGKEAEGQASPHTGKEGIWPMGIILRAMTSTDDKEIVKCIHMLKNTHAGKGFMHESFNKDNCKVYSRDWFAWANTLFGELIIKIYHERPHLLKNQF